MAEPLNGRVILTYGRSLMALVIARSLAKRGIEVIGCDDVSMTVLTFSKHVQETFTVAPWESRPDDFLDDLERAVRTYAPRDGRPYVLMPVFREAELISRHRRRFEPLIQVAAPDCMSMDLVSPKDRLSELMARQSLQGPKAFLPKSKADLKPIGFAFPLVVKPTDGVGGRGVSIVNSEDELSDACTNLGFDPPPLVQEFSPGHDYCVAVLAKGGQLQAIMAYKNVFTFPRKAGAGAVRESVDETPFREAVSKLLAATQWNGVCEIDFRWTGNTNDVPQIIELNARFWAGIFHSIETGVDFPWLLYCQAIGQHFEEPKPQIGVVTKTPAVWLFATLEEIAASDPHLAAAGEAWRNAKTNLVTGKLAVAMEEAANALGATSSLKDLMDAMSEAISRTRNAPSELSSDKDPLVALGALFILSHLIRHGRLPPEVTYRPATPAPKAPTSDRRRPAIGITKPEHGDLASWWAMKIAVWMAGGRAVKITAGAPGDPRTIDGLIFGGGSDIYPLNYAGEPKPGYRYDLARGDMEASWAATAREHDLPVLGVCRGAQMLNVFAGGTLHADLHSYDKPISARGLIEPLFLRKPIKVATPSLLAKLLGKTALLVNAIHCQAIARVGAGLHVVAREPNGIIQGIEDTSRRFWIGVQFHPELMLYRKPFRQLFKALVDAAAVRRMERRNSVQALGRENEERNSNTVGPNVST